MSAISLASWRRRTPLPVTRSAGASGCIHAAVLALALFGYPVFDIVFAPPSGVPGDILAHGDENSTGSAGDGRALDIRVTAEGEQTRGGIDPNNDVPTQTAGEVGFTVSGDSPNPQTRAGEPDAALTPPIAAAAEPTRRGTADGVPEGSSHQLAAREILVMVTLRPNETENLLGAKAGKRQIADADGTDAGQDDRSRAAQAAVALPGPAPAGEADMQATVPPASLPAASLASASLASASMADLAGPPVSRNPERSGEMAPGIAVSTNGPMLDRPPHGVAREATGDPDDERTKRFSAIILAVTGNDEQFARAIMAPRPVADTANRPDPAKARRLQLLQAAATAGYARAQFALARQYIIGEQPQATMREAIELLREAAERGDIDAQLLLGVIYAQGKLARKDLVEAGLFLALAAAQGAPGVEDVIAEIERDMTLREIIEARRAGRNFKKLLHAASLPRAEGTHGDLLRDELLDAAAAGNTAWLARALARGANIEDADSAGRTAVINAAWRGRADAIEMLLAVGADIDTRDNTGRSALTWAASNGHTAIVERLIEAGADIDAVDQDGTTALLRAAWNGHRSIVEKLIAAGARIDNDDPADPAANDYASRSGNPDLRTALRKIGI